jgi:ATP synthase F1 delta subunit
MTAAQVAKKYGTALFNVARTAKRVEEFFVELSAVREYVKSDAKFLAFIRAPQIPDADKAALLKVAFAERVSRPVYEFLIILNRKRRLPHLAEIVDFYEQLYMEAIGVIKARITTAVPLGDQPLAALTGKLEKLTGKRVRAEAKVDPEIIGGVVVVLGNRVIDQSLRYQMQLLRERLLALKVH